MSEKYLNKWYSNKKILVIGGHGFIGSYLVKKLKQFNAKVYIMSRHKDRNKDNKFIIGDITNQKFLFSIVKKHFDVIFNCSGISGNNQNDPNILSLMYKTNINGCINLMTYVHRYSPKTKIVLIGSRQEYGKVNSLPTKENSETFPISNYGYTKLVSTLLAKYYHQNFNLKITVLRISNVYGAYKSLKSFNKYNIINQCLQLAIRGGKFIIYGNGNQLRDYLYIDDAINVLLEAGFSNKSNGEVYNIGFGKGISLKEMIMLIAKNSKLNVIYKKWPKSDKDIETGDYISDISKSIKELNWKPQYNFERGIKKSLNLLKNNEK